MDGKVEERFNSLVQWVVESGGQSVELEMKQITTGNRAIVSKNDLTAGTVLMKVPKRLAINGDQNDMYATLISEMAKGDESSYKPYLDILPKEEDLSYFPIYKYSYLDFLFLEKVYPEMYRLMRGSMDRITRYYIDFLVGSTGLDDKFKRFETVMYCDTLIKSRSWTGVGMVPLADLFQHSFDPNVKMDFVSDSDFYMAVTSEDVKAGEELSILYNIHSPLHFYVNYGIDCLLPHNFVSLSFDFLNKDNELGKMKTEYMKTRSIPTHIDFRMSDKVSGEFLNESLDILKLLRLSLIKDDDLKDRSLDNLDCSKPLFLKNEMEVLSTLKNALKDKIVKMEERDDYIYTVVKKENEIVERHIKLIDNYWVSLLSN